MKTVVCNLNEIYSKAQEYIDSFPEGATIALAYNQDTARLSFLGKKTVQINECGGLIGDAFQFDISVSDYSNEHIDLAVLGLGYKSQIGFNEIGNQYDSKKHIQKLTDSTKEEYSFLGEIPDYGETLGIKDIVDSDNIIVICTGEKRSEALYNMLYARDDGTVPSAFLQLPRNVIVFADEEAASKL